MPKGTQRSNTVGDKYVANKVGDVTYNGFDESNYITVGYTSYLGYVTYLVTQVRQAHLIKEAQAIQTVGYILITLKS